MHWWQALASVASGIAAWRWIIRPTRRAWRELLLVLSQVRDASGGVQRLALEMEALSGSIVQLATQLLQQQQEHHARLTDLGELYVDLVAAVARHRKRIEELEGAVRDADHRP